MCGSKASRCWKTSRKFPFFRSLPLFLFFDLFLGKFPCFSFFKKPLFKRTFLKTLPWWLLGKSLKYRNWIGSLPKSEKFLKPSNIYQAVLNFSEILVIVPDSCSLSQFRYSQVSNCKGIYQREEGWAFGETKNSNNSNTNE